MRFTIEPVGLHWLMEQESASDLCAHAGVRVTNGDQVLIDTGSDSYAVSTGALYLLRALEFDHLNSDEDHLFPHCGHEMMVHEGTRSVVNISGCGQGIDWRVMRIPESDSVSLEFYGGPKVRLTFEDWRFAVAAFSQRVRDFYFAGDSKVTPNEWDRVWHQAFLAEWDRRHSAAICA